MGFYGQVMYEFTKMFSKFMITQASASEIPTAPPETSQDKFFEAKGWEYHYEITQTDLGPFAATYFTKDNYKFIIEFNHTSLDGYWIIIYFDILK